MKIIKPSKPISILNSIVFCDLYQTINLPSLFLLASIDKTYKIFPHVCFMLLALVYMSQILFYQFINLLERFGKCILYPNFLLNGIDRVGFASYFAFYATHLDLSTCAIIK